MKKLTSIFLIILLTVSTFGISSVFAVESSSAEADDYINDCILLLAATDMSPTLGQNMEADVSREVFLRAILTTLRVPPSSGSESLRFTDVNAADELYGYLSTAVRLGIISDADSFSPERAITYNEAFKITAIALGYAMEGYNYGGYPNGYVYVASSLLSLTKNMTYGNGTDNMTVGNAYILLREFSEAPIRIQTGFGDEQTFETSKDITILSEYYHMYKLEGIIDSDCKTSLYSLYQTDENEIAIDGKTYKCELPYRIGTNVTGYAKDNESTTDEIVYLKEEDNRVIEISSDDISYADSKHVEIYTDSKNKSLKIQVPISFIYNQKAYTEYTYEDFLKPDRKFTFIDNNDDGTYDVVLCSEAEILYISSVSKESETLYDTNKSKSISFKDITYDLTINGKKVSFAEIMPGSIAMCYYSKDKEYLNIDICSRSISGIISGFDNTEKKMYIGDSAYDYTEYFEKYYMPSVSLGQTYTFVLTPDGKISAKYNSDGSQLRYAYLLDIAKGTGLSNDISLKMYDQSGDIVIYRLKDKVKFDSESILKSDAYLRLTNNNSVIEQVMGYSVDSNGEISHIDTAGDNTGYYDENGDPYDNLTKFNIDDGSGTAGTTIKFKANQTFIPYFTAPRGSCIYFIISQDESVGDEYRCSNILSFSDDQPVDTASLIPYNVTQAGTAKILLYKDTKLSAAGTFSQDEPGNGVVASFKRVRDEDGEAVDEIGVYTPEGKFEYYKVTDDKVYADNNIEASADGQRIHVGDYIRFEYNVKNEVQTLSKDFDVEKQQLNKYHKEYEPDAVEHSAILKYHFAKVITYNDINTSFAPIIKDGNSNINWDEMLSRNYTVLRHDYAKYAKVNLKSKTVSPATRGDIITYLQDKENCSTVLMRSRYSSMTNMVIYVNE